MLPRSTQSGLTNFDFHIGPVRALGRQARGQEWGPFQLAQIFSGGVQIGWGCTCKRHLNCAPDNEVECKKQITFGKTKLSDAQCIIGLKRWLIAGFDVSPHGADSRSMHVAVDARHLADISFVGDLDAMLAAKQAAHLPV